ncbi:MAG: hypothetical protein IJN85_00465, partial [Oscillospiraceae bacterium]|nr:hypothetical protein [Oscillospiraceae bacterium]
DVPSGVNASNGNVSGVALRCTKTVTFNVGRLGLCLYPAKEYAGEICVKQISFTPKAVEDADIIVTAISSQEKILKAEWIKPGAFYSHVAGLEDEFDVARKASKIICDNWETVKHRTQTISQMYKQGLLSDDDIYADLHQIIKGEKNGRENDDEFIYFNSVGMSFTDVALANWMYKLAVSKNVGRIISMKNKSMFDVD